MKRLIFFASLAAFLFLAIPLSHAQVSSSETLQNICSSVASTGNPPSGMSQSTLNGIEAEMQELSSALTSLQSTVTTSSNGPSIAGIQGYNPTTNNYTAAITPNTYLVLYGTFSASNNQILIDGDNTIIPSYQSSNQLNVPLANLAAGYHIVTVISPLGATPAQLFTVSSASTGGSTTTGSPNLTIDGGTSATFTSTGSWSLSLAAGFAYANTSFTICATVNGNKTCTPNFGTTDANGNWTDSGSFSSANDGSWTEWIEFPGNVDSNQVSFTVGSSGTTPPTTPSPSNIPFPVIIYVTAPSLSVRSAPNTSASLAGSQVLYRGDEFTADNEVVGQEVNEDGASTNLWWVSSLGDYVWSGGTVLSGIVTTTAASAPSISGVQGYNPATNAYTNGTAVESTTLILYGSFALTKDAVVIDNDILSVYPGTTAPTYESATQINVSLAGIGIGSHLVKVDDANGLSSPFPFTITAPTTAVTAPSNGSAPVLKNTEGYDPTLNLESSVANTFPFFDTQYTVLVLYGTFAPSGNTVNINGQVVPPSDIIFQDTNQIDASVNSFINRSAPLPFVVSVTDASGTSASISMLGPAGNVASVGTNSQESCECDDGTAVCVGAGGGSAGVPSDFFCGSTNDENPIGGGIGEPGCVSDGAGGYICTPDSN